MENFFRNSTVSGFIEKNKNKDNIDHDFIIDFDSRSYVRIMKLFHQCPETKIDFNEYSFPGINKIPDLFLNEKFNENFYLRFYLPKNNIGIAGRKCSKVIILFNGLNELQQFDLYDILGEYFANNNIAVVLLPTPLNLNRRISEDYDRQDKIYPTDRARDGNAGIFYLSYLKTYKELTFLIKKLKGVAGNLDDTDDFDFYSNYFDGKNVEINLLGYSLGGLKALAYFMKDFKSVDVSTIDNIIDISKIQEEQMFQSCITFNSGVNLQDSNVESIKINRVLWEGLLSQERMWLYYSESEILKKFPETLELNMAYRALYFRDIDNDEKLDTFREAKVNNILMNFFAISGGADLIVNTVQMQKLSPVTRINQLIVAKGDHHPGMQKSDWHDVLPRVEKSMLEFINTCGERFYKQNIITEHIRHLIEKAEAVDYVKGNCTEHFHQIHLSFILEKLDRNDQAELKKWMYRSAIHFPKFSEIIKKIFPQ